MARATLASHEGYSDVQNSNKCHFYLREESTGQVIVTSQFISSAEANLMQVYFESKHVKSPSCNSPYNYM